MSWDTFEYELYAKCVCGKGKVIQSIWYQEDDWGRTRGGHSSTEIQCADCAEKYHVEHHVRHYWCPPWVGSGVSDRIFLVPNGISIPEYQAERHFYFSKIDEEIASQFTLEEIKDSINDMQTNRYTTKLRLESSQKIVRIYYKEYKKKSLNLIVPILQSIQNNYQNYEWTPETIAEYRKAEKVERENNEKAIETAMAQSFELKFSKEPL